MRQLIQTRQTETFPIPINPVTRRLESIDILRGLLMLLMAIDHTRDYFTSASGFDPTDATRSWPALFVTRWITHLCAPGFIALTGLSVYLQRQRGKSAGRMAKLLFTRGLWLAFLEITVISFGWSFAFAPGLQVIWAIGISMIFLAALQGLPTAAIGVIGAAIVLLHNLADTIRPSAFGSGAIFWTLLHSPGPLFFHHRFIGVAAYPIVPWVGVICLGFAFGPVMAYASARRERFAAILGSAFLLAFVLLRVLRGYGDEDKFEHLATPAQTAMSFFEVEKYPPSLQYLLATLGIILLAFAFFDAVVSHNRLSRVRGVVEVYGRVPFFYYVLHIYILHALALGLSALQHRDWHFWLIPGAVFTRHLSGWGYTLPGVYFVWLLVVAALYRPCLWFSRVKTRRRDWWLSYL